MVLAADFAERLGRGESAPVQVIVDGSDPNTAGLTENYVQGVWANWLQQEAVSAGGLAVRPMAMSRIIAQPRYWYNPEIDSRDFLIPGAVAINMTLIGTLLTALVVAREWEARHDGSTDGNTRERRRFSAWQTDPLLRLGDGRDGPVGGDGDHRVPRAVPGLGVGLGRCLIGVPGGDASSGPLDLDRDQKPVRRQPGR